MQHTYLSDVEQAKVLLKTEGTTLALCLGQTVYTSTLTGVKPMVELLTAGTDLNGFSAADKIVGRAAALLMVKAGVRAVYSPVMSRGAMAVFSENHICCTTDVITEHIINRRGTGPCPMEEAVLGTDDPDEAFEAIKLKLFQLQQP